MYRNCFSKVLQLVCCIKFNTNEVQTQHMLKYYIKNKSLNTEEGFGLFVQRKYKFQPTGCSVFGGDGSFVELYGIFYNG